jgi:PilZ domain
MSPRAPIHVPVELRHDGRNRWFRLTSAVSVDGLGLVHVAPEELDGTLGVAFHLPGDAAPIRCRGRIAEEVVGEGEEERAERRAVVFADLDEAARARITNYVNERLGLI